MKSLSGMGLLMTGDGDAATVEVTTSLRGHCLAAIEGCEEILGDLDEEDEENSFFEKSLKFLKEKLTSLKMSQGWLL